jgi:hypothetical protein
MKKIGLGCGGLLLILIVLGALAGGKDPGAPAANTTPTNGTQTTTPTSTPHATSTPVAQLKADVQGRIYPINNSVGGTGTIVLTIHNLGPQIPNFDVMFVGDDKWFAHHVVVETQPKGQLDKSNENVSFGAIAPGATIQIGIQYAVKDAGNFSYAAVFRSRHDYSFDRIVGAAGTERALNWNEVVTP